MLLCAMACKTRIAQQMLQWDSIPSVTHLQNRDGMVDTTVIMPQSKKAFAAGSMSATAHVQ